ncbi:hypothetical protein [Streptomyces sp. 5-10]|uniref:hypothetical protein n=1 Tax=Streptomyces sp. 5-10 TaxID=878925 RepID=UPI00168AC325|nr:hypothetical protein [Streptomyces sp. 5-10]MBD3004708.1 hypothetical protein [Streptomyces sp. 5-10]
MSDDIFRSAISRVSYRLTFGKTPEPRKFLEDGLLGPFVPDAFQDGKVQAGEWDQKPPFEVDDARIAERDWLAHFLSMAVNEAVHEALEHFQVDGKPYLNPHGKEEEWIYVLVNELASQLAEIAEKERNRA